MTAMPSRRFLSTLAAATALTVASIGLSGCFMGDIQLSGALPSITTANGPALHGIVHGGQFPVFNATLQLYAAGQPAAPTTGSATGGFGQGATALIPVGSMTSGSTNNYYPSGAHGCTFVTGNTNNCTALPTTGAGGAFSISGDYSCSGSTELYLVATGGDPTGANLTTNNNAYLAMMAALGPCSGISSSTSIVLNEVTTVGAVYALSQFIGAPTGQAASTYTSQGCASSCNTGVAVNIGASSGPVGGYGTSAVQTQQIGLVNAFKMVNNLTDYTQGTANPIAANTWATPYSAMTYTIADILAYCINTLPSSANTQCANVMGKTTFGGYTTADTIQAAWSMAHYPVNQVAALYGYISGSGNPFAADLGTQPSGFEIQLGLAPTSTATALTTLNSAGNVISNASAGAFDQYGHLWVVNMNASSTSSTGTAPLNKVYVTEIDSNGNFLSGPYNSYTATGGYGGGTDPCASTYNHYLAYNGNSVAEAIAVDLNNTVWVTNAYEYTTATGGIAMGNCNTNSALSLMRITGSSATGTGAAIAAGVYVEGTPQASVTTLAIDSHNNVWAPASSSAYNIFPNAGTTDNVTTSLYPGSYGNSTIIDSSGNAWTAGTDPCTGTNGAGIIYESPASTTGATPTETAAYVYNGATGCPTLAADGPTVTVAAASNLGQVSGLAADKNGGIWAANYKTQAATTGGTTLTYLLPTSTNWITAGTVGTPGGPIPTSAALSSTSGYGVSTPYFLAVDGNNYVWVANSSNKVGELSVTLSGGNDSSIQSVPSGGSGLNLPYFSYSPFFESAKWVGIDPSGNVWFMSESGGNGSATQTNYVTVLVGAACPVVTPMALQIATSRVGQAPQ
jgi:hypothetical protein